MRGLYDPAANPAIGKLVEFAAQNPGLEFGNYGNWPAYNQERASITRDWKRFIVALRAASAAGVTDQDVIEAAPRAFSGRLEWISKDYLRQKHGMNTDYTPRWDYTTGQYFPTEYRKAAATVLEYATREHLRSLPPKHGQPRTIAELKALNEANGGGWFGKGEMSFFGTRIESPILHGQYFISSEQPPHGPRKFTVRSFDDEGSIGTVGEFCAYHDADEAETALESHLKGVMV